MLYRGMWEIMFRRLKNLVILVMSLSLIFTMIACSSDGDEDKVTINPKEIKDEIKDKVDRLLPEEEQDSIMNSYYKLLIEKKLAEDVTNFIDENIDGLNKENIETMIKSLEDYLSKMDSTLKEDYDLLNKYKEYVSDEMKSYLELIGREINNIFTDGERLNVDISEIMDRALEAEKHLDKFPEGKLYNKIYDLYGQYIKGSILGTGNPYIFAEEGTTTIRQEYIDKYKNIIEENKDSKISQVLSQYVDILEEEDGDLNSNLVNDFYDKLDILIEDSFIR